MSIDIKFPPRPVISSQAKDLITKVSMCLFFLVHTYLDMHKFSLTFLLLGQLLVKDPSQRIPLKLVLSHPWIVANADPTGVYTS